MSDNRKPIALVAWHEPQNLRRNYGEMDAIRNSLADKQWAPDNSVPAEPISESIKVAEMARRQTLYDNYKAVATQEGAKDEDKVALKVFEDLYTTVNSDGSGRTLIEPKFAANAGFRRHRAYLGAMIQRANKKPSEKDLTPDTSVHGLVPIRETTYRSDVERIIDQQLENELQGTGTKKMDALEKLRITKLLFDKGCKESDIRKLYSSSTGQKMFGICLLDSNFEDLKILPRILDTPSESPDFIPLNPIRHDEVVKWNNRFEAQRRVAAGLALSENLKGLPPIDADEVDRNLREKAEKQKGSTGNAPKIMSKPDIETMRKSDPLKFLRVAGDVVSDNSRSTIKAFEERKDATNAAFDLLSDKDEKKADVAAEVFLATKAEPDLLGECAKLVRTGKTDLLRKALASLNAPPVTVVAPAAPTPAEAVATADQPVRQQQGNNKTKPQTAKV